MLNDAVNESKEFKFLGTPVKHKVCWVTATPNGKTLGLDTDIGPNDATAGTPPSIHVHCFCQRSRVTGSSVLHIAANKSEERNDAVPVAVRWSYEITPFLHLCH